MKPDVHFTPTPDRVIAEMLRLAEVKREDVVYDLGCGDGRILIRAATECGASGVGIEIDERLVKIARVGAESAGVGNRVRFEAGDLFEWDLSGASVLTLYLLDSLNVRLRPKLLEQMEPGSRVVSYSFEMGDWECDAHTPMAANGVSLWIVPENFSGAWVIAGPRTHGDLASLRLQQRFQVISGVASFEGSAEATVEGRVNGHWLGLSFGDPELRTRMGKLGGRLADGRWQIEAEGAEPRVVGEAHHVAGTRTRIDPAC